MGVNMTEGIHDRLQLSGLLDGPVDADSVADWPAWAREHLRVCASCQTMLVAERQLRDSLHQLAAARWRRQRSGPPTRAQAQNRLAAREPANIDDLIPRQQPLAHPVMRFEASPLELRRTSGGVRVWHPDAREVLILAAESDQQVAVLRHHREDTPGVGLDLSFEPSQGARVLALASNQPLDPDIWSVWLRDALCSGQLADLVAQNSSSFVHLAQATIPPPLRSSLLRVRDQPLPDASPDVAVLLKRAAAAGREDDTALAASLYRQALELAFTANDLTGQIKAGIGIAYALKGMGYPVDGDKVLRWVIDNHTLDANWASWVCQHMATDALYRMELDVAEAWVGEAARVAGGMDVWSMLILAGVYYTREDWEGVWDVLQKMSGSRLPPKQRTHTESLVVASMVQLGRVTEAREVLAGIEEFDDLPLDSHLQRVEAMALVEEATEGSLDWERLHGRLVPSIAVRDGGLLSTWDCLPFVRLVEQSSRKGHGATAAALFRLRFLDSSRAQRPEHRLLGLCASYDGLRLVSPSARPRVRELSLSAPRLRQLIVQARDELRSRDDLGSCRGLAQLLFEGDDLEPGQVWVGSDGLLADAPMLAIAASVKDDAAQVPSFRDLVGLRRPPPQRDAGCRAIVSLADAQGNLPWASREVARGEASLWLRGKDVTKTALQLEAPCGLLHLGLHARREQGVPELVFADGPMGPLEIAQRTLPGAPVVLLAGCFTAVASVDRGVERSLADAFLRAGASAVIATRWPVQDRELHGFVRALVQAWPFRDVAGVVTTTCLDLRAQGQPARCWAAPVVY